ncbi:MAG: hypothetical protein K8R36_03850 [Planctomycetales bacterium]|nr:hypothetical protein [Planctomycetales bacterium]
MARKVVNRKELRAENDAAEAKEKAAEAAGEDVEGGKKKKAKKPAVKRKSRAKSTEPARKMLFWGVYNQSLKRVAKYDFTQKKAAEAKAAELSPPAASRRTLCRSARKRLSRRFHDFRPDF